MKDLVFFNHGNYYVGDFSNITVSNNNPVLAKFKIDYIPENTEPRLIVKNNSYTFVFVDIIN